jgi:hypothetical protein
MFKIIKNTVTISLVTLIIGIFMGLYGCSDTTTSPQSDNLDLSIMSSRNITDNAADTLILDTVKVLINNIKLNVSGNSDSTNFKVGPYVFYLNFASLVTTVSSAYIPAGTYDKIIFDFHKLGDNETPPDPDFVDINGRYSTVVKGTFNGTSFVFKSDKSYHQKLNFTNSLVVSASGKSNITIHAAPYMWFYKSGILLDPNNSSNRGDIENNIKDNVNENFKAFKDNNKDGQPDN